MRRALLRATTSVWLGLTALSALAPASARADQPRDWMFGLRPDGSLLLLDYFGTGGQVSLENNLSFYENANTVTTRVSGLVGYPLADVAGHADLRILFLSVGGTFGYRTIWRNLRFEPGEDGEYCIRCDRAARREQDPIFKAGQSTDQFAYAEGHLRLFAPFNEHVLLASALFHRYEGRRDRSYDWFYTNIHDGGWNTRWETSLFFKHRDWGGIAPYVQMMSLPRGARHEVEWAFGFNALTRPGLIRRDDLLFLTFLIRPGDEYYGQHAYYSPVRALLVYRMQLSL